MPQRTATRRYRYEADTERVPLTPARERRLRKLVLARAPADLAEWLAATDEMDRFYAAPRAAMAACVLGERALVGEIAHAGLALAARHTGNWNVGNAVHFAHTALGLTALEGGDLATAAEHLRLSGDTRGSPQLNSFGPSMLLARRMLLHGHREAVLAYLEQCRAFWRMGPVWLSIWQKMVMRGAVPNFTMQLYR